MTENLTERMRRNAENLWDQALTHSSCGGNHNERLEFLGNGVLNLALADLLFHRFPESEGKLSKMCNYLRSDEVLNEIGREMGLDALIKYVPSTKDGRIVDSMVAGCLEAVIGAVYESKGYEAAKELVAMLFLTDHLLERVGKDHDPITELKEMVEVRGRQGQIRHAGFSRDVEGKRLFYHVIELDGRTAVGMGPSKKKAEVQASRCILSILTKDASSD